MRQVFVAQHPTEAHFVKGLLEAEGIAADVRGELLWGMRGEAPTPESLPSVWVREETQLDRALAVIRTYQHADSPVQIQGQAWRCPRCGEQLAGQFTACWNCGAPRPTAR